MRGRIPPERLYLYMVFAGSLFFSLMAFISGIYRVQTARLDPFQLVLLGTALEGAVFLFEVPTGIVADLRSRRLSVVVGYAIIGLGFLLEGAFPTFVTIFLAQAVWGIGYTFISGAREAWLADEIGDEKLTGVYVQAGQYGRVASFIGLCGSAALGLVDLALPILVGGGLMLSLALVLALLMPETRFLPVDESERSTFQKMGHTFKEGLAHVRGRPSLRLIMLIGLFFGLYAEGADRLTEAHLLENFTFPSLGDPVIWFFLMSLGVSVAGYGINEVIRRRVDVDDLRRSLQLQFGTNLLLMGAIAFFALAPAFAFAYSSAIAMHVLRGTGGPFYHAWLNKQVGESRIRATILSMNGQVDAIGQFMGGPLIGGIGRLFSLPAAMLSMLVFLAPAVALFQVALHRLPRSSEGQLDQGEAHPKQV